MIDDRQNTNADTGEMPHDAILPRLAQRPQPRPSPAMRRRVTAEARRHSARRIAEAWKPALRSSPIERCWWGPLVSPQSLLATGSAAAVLLLALWGWRVLPPRDHAGSELAVVTPDIRNLGSDEDLDATLSRVRRQTADMLQRANTPDIDRMLNRAHRNAMSLYWAASNDASVPARVTEKSDAAAPDSPSGI